MTNPDNKIIRANNNGILLPRGIVILSAVAVLCVIIDLIGGLIEYFQDAHHHPLLQHFRLGTCGMVYNGQIVENP